MASFEETETTVSGVQADKCFYIGTNRAKHITRLEREVKAGRAELVRTQGEWRDYRVSADHFDPITGFKRTVKLSDERREELAERMRKLHN